MNKFCLSLFFLCGILFSCQKQAGKGGNTTISGKVKVKDYDNNFQVLIQEYPAQSADVYIIYGDNLGESDRVRTDYKGEFSFPYLYPGNYTIYVYSDDTTFRQKEMPIVKNIQIEKGMESVKMDSLVIYDL